MELIDATSLARRLPMVAAIDALGTAFAAGVPPAPLRSHVETPDGQLYVMPASGPQGAGAKLITLTPSNPDRGLPFLQGVYVLFSRKGQEPEAAIDAASLTALRTAAVSGLATRFLAREDARRLVIFGAGVQGRAHLDAMRAVCPIEELVVVSRSEERAAALARVAQDAGLVAEVGDPSAVAGADIVCTCTTATEPLFDGHLLRPGTHVNAVGAYLPTTREVDETTVRRAAIVVETRDVALAEAGDLLLAFGGVVGAAAAIGADLSEIACGREVDGELTLFESVGMAFEDLAVARAAVDAMSTRPPTSSSAGSPIRLD